MTGNTSNSGLRRWVAPAGWVYFTILFGWLAAYLLLGDGLPHLALVNALAVYLFFPLPLALAAAAVTRRRELWAGCALGAGVFAWLWGGLFVPRAEPASAAAQTLTVMTYNVLGKHGVPEPIVEVIRYEGPDVAALQEVTPGLAAALQRELRAEYPYQALHPAPGVWGMGVLSKYPLRETGERLPLEWVGTPQALEVDWDGQAVTLVNVHMWPPGIGPARSMWQLDRAREAQAQALRDFAAQAAARGPVLVVGDVNAAPLSTAYKIIRSGGLEDAWAQAGWGLGHTFPGAQNEASSRPGIGPLNAPQWLVRIDYVFFSEHFTAVEARTARFDGVSDHRGVVARLAIQYADGGGQYTDGTDRGG